MLKRLRLGIVATLFCFGFWQFGQGAYIPAKAWLAQELLQRAWARAETGQSRAVPWPWADTWPVARIRANDGVVDLIILAGGSGRTMAFGPGHLSASALPGETGNAVVAGHRDTHFRFLKNTAIGDVVDVETPDGRQHRYRVTATEIVDSRTGALLLDTEDAVLSLITCYPFDATEAGGPLRYVVTARMLY